MIRGSGSAGSESIVQEGLCPTARTLNITEYNKSPKQWNKSCLGRTFIVRGTTQIRRTYLRALPVRDSLSLS